MKTDFMIIIAGMLAVGAAALSVVEVRPRNSPQATEEARIAAHDPGLKSYSEMSPYMRSER